MGAFNPVKAVTYNFQVPVDQDIGLRFGAEAQGLLVKSVGYKPSREAVKKQNHRKFVVGHIFTTPEMVLSFDAEILQLAGALAGMHPGQPVSKSNVADFFPDIAHGFDQTDPNGYFLAENVDTNAPPGDLYAAKFDLRWFPSANTDVNLVDAAA